MAMHEVRIPIRPGAAIDLEDLLAELGLTRWMVIEDPIQKRAWLTGFFDDRATAEEGWAELAPRMTAGRTGADPEFIEVEDRDWKESYKDHFTAWSSGPVHWVPVWERETYELPPGEVAIWLDPGMAFGTGNHETTRLCLERMTDLAAELASGQGGVSTVRVIDAGSGSGILSLSAAALGMHSVRGFDLDPEAVRISRENAVLNGLAGQVVFEVADLEGGLGAEQADLVLANILADVLVREKDRLLAAIAPGGRLVLSGILAAEVDGVRAAFEAAGPDFRYSSRTMGEWADLMVLRSA